MAKFRYFIFDIVMFLSCKKLICEYHVVCILNEQNWKCPFNYFEKTEVFFLFLLKNITKVVNQNPLKIASKPTLLYPIFQKNFRGRTPGPPFLGVWNNPKTRGGSGGSSPESFLKIRYKMVWSGGISPPQELLLDPPLAQTYKNFDYTY